MPMLTLQGGPVAPSGETLDAATRLVVTFRTPYRDDAGVYPVEHTAALDTTNGTWKPVGASDGTPFQLPGSLAGGSGPLVTLEERQVHEDGSEVTSRRLARLVEHTSGAAALIYADLPAAFPLDAWRQGLDFRNPKSAAYAVTVL